MWNCSTCLTEVTSFSVFLFSKNLKLKYQVKIFWIQDISHFTFFLLVCPSWIVTHSSFRTSFKGPIPKQGSLNNSFADFFTWKLFYFNYSWLAHVHVIMNLYLAPCFKTTSFIQYTVYFFKVQCMHLNKNV